ncbi:MAG: hypothetical protein ACRDJ9_26445, partial [Dehalococcoidia bacterium]
MTRARSNARKGRRAPAAPFDPFTWLAKVLLQWQTFAVLAAAAVVLISIAMWSEVGGALGTVQRGLVRTFGAGLAFLFVGAVAAALAVYFRKLPRTRRGLLRLVGGLALVVFIWGIAGWPRPGWTVGGVSLGEVTLGGEVGGFLGRSLVGLLIWFWTGVAAAFILAPRMMRRVLNAVPPAARTVYSWRIPQRTFRMVVEGTRALFSLRDPDPPAAGAVSTEAQVVPPSVTEDDEEDETVVGPA